MEQAVLFTACFFLEVFSSLDSGTKIVAAYDLKLSYSVKQFTCLNTCLMYTRGGPSSILWAILWFLPGSFYAYGIYFRTFSNFAVILWINDCYCYEEYFTVYYR